MKAIRVKDTYKKHIFEFVDELLIVCPKCEQQATVIGGDFRFLGQNAITVKLVCQNCGYSKYLEEIPGSILYTLEEKRDYGNTLLIGPALDPFFINSYG